MDNSIIFKIKKTGNFLKEIFAKMFSNSNYNQYLVQWIKFRIFVILPQRVAVDTEK